MKRTFLVAIILSALITWGHIFFDLKAFVPDPVAKLAVFILFIGMINWIIQKGQEEELDS